MMSIELHLLNFLVSNLSLKIDQDRCLQHDTLILPKTITNISKFFTKINVKKEYCQQFKLYQHIRGLDTIQLRWRYRFKLGRVFPSETVCPTKKLLLNVTQKYNHLTTECAKNCGLHRCNKL
jgi:hypothetical protein